MPLFFYLIDNLMPYHTIIFYLIDNQMPYQSIGDFPVNFIMNQFNLSNWYDNDESDLNEFIDLIKNYDVSHNQKLTQQHNPPDR
jgi:hypothetical protein